MSNEKSKTTKPIGSADGAITLDAETARLYLSTVDLAKVRALIERIDASLSELSRDDRRQCDVIYASMAVIANAMTGARDLSPQFRERMMSGFGDIMGAMMMTHLNKISNADERDEPTQPKESEAPPDPSRAVFDHLVDVDIGDVYTIEEYRNMVEDGSLVDSDGSGHPCIRKDADTFFEDTKTIVEPSKFATTDLRGATHVVWYNK